MEYNIITAARGKLRRTYLHV